MNEKNHENLKFLKNKILQLEEEMDGVQTRLQNKLNKEKTFAISNFAKDLLELIDNLELCILNFDKSMDLPTKTE